MFKTKTCPRCGAELFSDMDVCYECLFDFAEHERWVPDEAYSDLETVGVATSQGFSHHNLLISTSTVDVVVPVYEEGIVIGRGTACDIVLHNPAVSRRHVRVEPDGDKLVLRDLGARNRAEIRGRKMENVERLEPGSSFCVCDTQFEFIGGAAE